MTNMYKDLKQMINATYGCKFDCIYCEKSYKKFAKRNLHRCLKCYNYEVHEHLVRLNKVSLRKTIGDEFIWISAFSDISFAKIEWVSRIVEYIRYHPKYTFFIQTKDPLCFTSWYALYPLPDNLILGITLETNRNEGYDKISKAPLPRNRGEIFSTINHSRKFVTIEPILNFDNDRFIRLIQLINPERIYIGYDTKKSIPIELQPTIYETNSLIRELRESGFYVKEKYIPEVLE